MITNKINIQDYVIKETKYNSKYNKVYEGIMTQGNGYLHVRASFEEGLFDAPQNMHYQRTMKSVTTEAQRNILSKQGTFLPLIMGKNPFLEEVIINLPYFMGIKIIVDGEKLDMIHSAVENYSRMLNMKTGELTRELIFRCKSGAVLKIVFKRFASMINKHLFIQKVSVKALNGNPKIQIISGIDADVTTNGYNHFTNRSFMDNDEMISCKVHTDLGFEVQTTCVHKLSCPFIKEIVYPNNGVEACYTIDLTHGMEFNFKKYTGIASSRDLIGDYENVSVDTAKKASSFKYDKLLSESTDIWEKLWKDADIKIKGDNDLLNGYRFSAYHLMRCNTGEDYRVQVCAKGFAGEAYYGRYFWDSEIYLLPFYIYINPNSALQMIKYRYHTLNGARKNASRYSCHGARYPWQSGLTGEEQCSLWEYADNEIHITADVAFGVMHYYYATNDTNFMTDYGLEILLETARFWIDRCDTDENGVSHLINVMGPDEYSPMTFDNGFTNRMVKYNLTSAIDMYNKIKLENPKALEKVINKIEFSENELLDFKKLLESLTVPYDIDRDLYLQSADFESYAVIDMQKYWLDKNKPFGSFVPQEKIYRSQCIKQADTIAMMIMFPNEFTDKQVKIAYDYYKPMTTHDSSLSPAVHTMAANRICNVNDVNNFMELTLGVDLSLDRFGAEDGIHIANCGFLWQLIVNSFMGISASYLNNNKLNISPNLPKHIEEITANIVLKGEKYQVTVNQCNYSINKL